LENGKKEMTATKKSEIRVMQNFLHSKTLFSDLHGKDSKTSLEKKKKKKLPAHKNVGKSKTRKWENTEVSPKWVLERSYLQKYST
jgi:hypothetical protein